MTTPPKYEDLVLKVAELERSEAALREELDCPFRISRHSKRLIEELQQRLTVAEQRERDLEGLLRDAESAHGKMLLSDPPQEAWKYHRISARIAAALNPATGRGGCGSGKPVPPSKPVAPPIRRVVNELVINKAEIEAHTTRNWRS